MKAGFFSQKLINEVATLKNVDHAKEYAYTAIREYSKHHPGVVRQNTDKAALMVSRAKSIFHLVIGMQNFALAHPSENLKVIR